MNWTGRAWNWVTAWPRGFVGWAHTAICALTTEEGRKGWAMLAALGATLQSSAYAGAVLWLVRKNPMLAFWLGAGALLINVIVVTGLMVLLGIKRDVETTITDHGVSARINDFKPVTGPAPVPPAAPPLVPPVITPPTG
jgi:hypothetical protein